MRKNLVLKQKKNVGGGSVNFVHSIAHEKIHQWPLKEKLLC